MRLKGQYQSPARKCAPSCRQGRRHFNRVMTIVLNHREHASFVITRWHVAIALKTPSHAFEFSQRLLHRCVWHIQFNGHSDRRQSIEYVVLTGQIEDHLQIRQRDAIASLGCEVHLRTDRPDVDTPYLGVCIEAVACNRTSHQWHDALYRRVISAQNGGAVKRHPVEKINKRFFQVFKVMAVSLHVIGIDIGHHGHHGHQV